MTDCNILFVVDLLINDDVHNDDTSTVNKSQYNYLYYT